MYTCYTLDKYEKMYTCYTLDKYEKMLDQSPLLLLLFAVLFLNQPDQPLGSPPGG